MATELAPRGNVVPIGSLCPAKEAEIGRFSESDVTHKWAQGGSGGYIPPSGFLWTPPPYTHTHSRKTSEIWHFFGIFEGILP